MPVITVIDKKMIDSNAPRSARSIHELFAWKNSVVADHQEEDDREDARQPVRPALRSA